MTSIELFEYDAVPTWGGFIYQGYTAVHIALDFIVNEKNNDNDISHYKLILEQLEDVSIIYDYGVEKRYISFHQVKSIKKQKLNDYMKALKQLMYEQALLQPMHKDVVPYLHTRKELKDVKDGDICEQMENEKLEIKKNYSVIENFANKDSLNQADKNMLLQLLKKDHLSINRSEYVNAVKKLATSLEKENVEEIKSNIKVYWTEIQKCVNVECLSNEVRLYKYNNNQYYIEYGDLEEEIKIFINKYIKNHGMDYGDDEINYIYFLLTEKIVNNVVDRHKNFGNKRQSIEIPFQDIIDILNSSVENYNERLNILELRNLFHRHVYEYCDSECDLCDNEKKSHDCKLKEREKEILQLSEVDFKSLCYHLNPDCVDSIEDRKCINQLMNENGILYCFLRGIQKIQAESDFENNKYMYHIEQTNQLLSGIYVHDDKGLERVVKRVVRNLQDNRKKEDLVNLFEADKFIIKGSKAAPSIWNNEVLKNVYDKEQFDKEKNYIKNLKQPEFVDIEQIILEEAKAK